MIKARCKDCVYFDADDAASSARGVCRFNAPDAQGFPAVVGDKSWCGNILAIIGGKRFTDLVKYQPVRHIGRSQ